MRGRWLEVTSPLPYNTDGGEGLAMRKGYRREAGSEGKARRSKMVAVLMDQGKPG